MRIYLVSLAAALCLSAAAAAFPFVSRHPQITRHRTEMGPWRLDVATNPFSGNIACRLRERRDGAFYQQGAIGFRFPSGWDVNKAVYRLDGGFPRGWRNDLPELIRLGTPIDMGGVDNPTRGVVWIPLSRLEGVNSIVIQPRQDRAARAFRIGGFQAVYETAIARGCVPDSRFVR